MNPILVFGLVCIPAVLTALMGKETSGLPLPEFIEEEHSDKSEEIKYYSKNPGMRKLYKMLEMGFTMFKKDEERVVLYEDLEGSDAEIRPLGKKRSMKFDL